MICPRIPSSTSQHFIVVCEAFLRIQPHFGLWLRVFNMKPKVVEGQHAECGGAMVSKLSHVSWPKGTFVETVKEWQKQWFYITEPRGANWAAAAEFNSGAPMWLPSSVEKTPNWSSSDEPIALQTRVQSMVDKDIKLVGII